MTTRTLLHTTAATYVAALVLLVYLADSRQLGPLLHVVRAVPFGDKVGHVLLIGTGALLVGLSCPGPTRYLAGYPIATSSLVLALVMTLEELSQQAFAARTCDPLDLAANLTGILVADHLARRSSWSLAQPRRP